MKFKSVPLKAITGVREARQEIHKNRLRSAIFKAESTSSYCINKNRIEIGLFQRLYTYWFVNLDQDQSHLLPLN